MIKFFRRLFGISKVKNVEELRRYIRVGDIPALANWIDYRIVYTRDRLPDEEWQSADVAIKKGKGDCEEKAVVAWEVGRTWAGWTFKLFILTRPNLDPSKAPLFMDAHAVCGFEDPKGRRGVVEGRRPYLYPEKTAWGFIFADIGGWEKHWEVDNKGRIL